VVLLNGSTSQFSTGRYNLFGKFLKDNRPLEFPQIIEMHLSKGYHPDKLRPIPKGLKEILDKAIVITERVDHKSMRMTVQNDRIMFQAQTSDLTELKDYLEVESYENITIHIEPKLLKAGVRFYDQWMITDDAVIMVKGNAIHLIGLTGS